MPEARAKSEGVFWVRRNEGGVDHIARMNEDSFGCSRHTKLPKVPYSGCVES